MAGNDPELRVVRQNRDGRRRYDEKGKRALVEAALRPGVSVARLAQEHRLNASRLRKWIAKYLMEREKATSLVSQEEGADERDSPHLGSRRFPTGISFGRGRRIHRRYAGA
ncbi:transposase [Paraburkholderia strydomiana]|uniref:transposase n=1 Tax=Paraburkholderia strydomiana TaxID=1245417 RepID=UPI0038BA5A9F